MRTIRSFSSLRLSPSFMQTHIKYMDYPSCKNCIYYKPHIFDVAFDFEVDFGTCKKYSEKKKHNTIYNLLPWKRVTYIPTHVCRNDNSLCGVEGKYFSQDHDLYNN